MYGTNIKKKKKNAKYKSKPISRLPAGTCPIRLAVFSCIIAPEVDNVNTVELTDRGCWAAATGSRTCNVIMFWGLPSCVCSCVGVHSWTFRPNSTAMGANRVSSGGDIIYYTPTAANRYTHRGSALRVKPVLARTRDLRFLITCGISFLYTQ